MDKNMVPVNNGNTTNNPATTDDEAPLIPTSIQMPGDKNRQGNDSPSDKVAENMIKVTTDMIKEGAATAKDNRIIRKKIVDSSISTTNADLEVQRTEYDRIMDKLSNPELQPDERVRCEKRAETISDRIHETSQAHQEDMRQNTPPPQKGFPVWGWITAIALTGLSCFFGGRYYQARH